MLLLGVDGLSVALIWLCNAIICICLLDAWEADEPIGIAILVAQSMILGLFMASWDLLGFYVLFEVILLPAALLIGMHGSTKTRLSATFQFV